MISCRRFRELLLPVALCLAILGGHNAFGQAPPVLNTVFPMGGQAGQSVEVTVGGSNLQGLRTLHCNVPGIRCERLDPTRMRLTIPADTPPGLCDLWAVGDNGVSSPRSFTIGHRTELVEVEPNETASALLENLESNTEKKFLLAMEMLQPSLGEESTKPLAPQRPGQGLLLKDASLEDIVNHLHALHIEPTFRHLLRN